MARESSAIKPITRREFTGTLDAFSITALSSFSFLEASDLVRLGFAGVGNRGDQPCCRDPGPALPIADSRKNAADKLLDSLPLGRLITIRECLIFCASSGG